MTFGSRLLVPMDGSDRTERVAEIAAQLAAETGGQLRLLSVVSADEEVGVRERYLEAVATSIASTRPVPVRCVVRKGLRIDREIEQSLDDDTTVVMATAATLAPHAGHIGSVAEQVVRSSSCPAVVVGPEALATLGGVKRVVVALDGSDLAELAIAPACELAGVLGAQLWLVTVASAQQVAAATAIGPVVETGYLRRLAGSACTGNAVQYEVLHREDPAEALLDFLEDEDVIVMSTHGRSGIRRIALGSVTTEVIRSAHRPVIVVPPLFEGEAPSNQERRPT